MKYSSHTLRTIINDKKSTGFTLIEMLVSLVIVAIIVASVYTAFDCGKNSWQVGETIVQKNQNARAALDFMSREISAMCLTVSSIYEIGLVYDSDSFRFFASIPENDGDWDLCKVSYRYYEFDDNGNGNIEINERRIHRSFLTSSTSSTDYTTLTQDPSTGWQPMVSNITGLDFTCLDENFTECSSWDSVTAGPTFEKLPKAVIITINVQDDKQLQAAQTFSTTVYIPGSEQ